MSRISRLYPCITDTLPCSLCHRMLALKEFVLRKTSTGKISYNSWCEECKRQKVKGKYINQQRAKYHANKDYYMKMNRTNHLKRSYGIAEEQYDKMFKRQQGKCLICQQEETSLWRGTVRRLAIDHCHKTGKVRGLLCQRCNMALGLLNDDLTLLKRAYIYIKQEGLR